MKLRKFKKVFAVTATLLLAFSSISAEALFAEEDVTKTLTAVLENMEVELTYKEGELPEDAVLNVAASEQTKADTMLEKAKTKVEGNVIDSKAFDVSVKDAQGNDLTLTSAASLTFKNIDMQNITKVFALNGEELEEQDAEIVEKNVDFAIKNLSSYTFVDVQKVETSNIETNTDEGKVKIENKVAAQNEQIKQNSDKNTPSNALAASGGINQVQGNPLSLKFSQNTADKGKYKLQVRVYDKETGEQLQMLPGSNDRYRFNNSDLKITLTVDGKFEIDSVYFDNDDNYKKENVAKDKNKRTLTNNVVTLSLDDDDTNFLDIYVNEKLPEVNGSLKLTTQFVKGSLTDDDYQYELKKSYNYVIVDQNGKQIEKNIVYDLYDLNGNKLNDKALTTQENGVLRIKTDRKVVIDLRRLAPEENKKYYIQQVNGDRYNTTNKVNSGETKQSKETEKFVINGNNNEVLFTNERKAVNELISYDKSATLKNWSKRTYDVTLSTGYKSNEVTVKENADIIFVLDTSGSMIYTDAKVTSTNRDGKLTIDELNKDFVYFSKENIKGEKNSYGSGITITNNTVRTALDKSKDTSDSKTKYYGINTSTDNKVIFFENGKWQYFKVGTPNTYYDLSENDVKNGLYTERSFILIDSMLKFIDGMSDDCSVGIVTFDNDGEEKQGLIKLNTLENRNKVKEAIKNSGGEKGNGTYIHTGLQTIISKKMLNNSDNEKYVITFTDGEDSDEKAAYTVADTLKKEASIYTIGIGSFGKEFLTKLASNPDQYLGSESMSDIYEFLEIISDRIGNAFFRGNIVDYIDPRFDLVDEEGNKLNVNDQVKNGDVIGTVGKDGDKYYVKWSNQSVKANAAGENYSWNATLHLKAKEDFLGGNIILTNGKATLDASASHLSANLVFPKPTVNVKELSTELDDYEVTLNLGDSITPKDYVEKLNSSINKDYLKLSTDDVNELLNSNGKILEKNYSYAGTNDVVGKLVYSLDYESDNNSNANWNNHNAERTSKIVNNKRQPIETYKLTVKYVPDTIESRETKVTFDKEPTHEYVSKEFGATGKYDVMVKNGPDITLDKTANQSSDARHFTIDLTASSLETTVVKSNPIDVVLLLDTSGSMKGNKIDVLNASVKKFVETLSELSPESRVAIITFDNYAKDITKGFKEVSTLDSENLQVGTGGNTNLNAGFRMAYTNYYHFMDGMYKGNEASDTKDEIYKPDSSRSQVLVTFSDGDANQPFLNYPPELPKPNNFNSFEASDQGGVAFAYRMKQLGINIYSIGLGDSSVPAAQQLTEKGIRLLKEVASSNESPYFTKTDKVDDLKSIFEQIANKIVICKDLKNVTITDTLTKEFKLTDEAKANLLAEGAKISEKSDGTTTITWENQTVQYKGSENMNGWERKIDVVANDTFLGGNYVPTNVNATLTVKESGKDYTHEFPKPTVNVGPLDITLGGSYDIVFKGDTITVKDQITKLYDTIKFGSTSINNVDFQSIQLNGNDIAKLLSDGTLTKDTYTYKGDGSFGKVVYTLEPKSLEDHKATTASNIAEDGYRIPVETYTLNVEYVPLTMEERLSLISKNVFTDPTNNEQIGASGEGRHKVYVAAGELDLTKEINKQYTDEPKVNANQSFVFKITKYDAADSSKIVDTFYQTISFSANDINNKSKTVKFKGLDKGYYTIEEVTNWSWKYELNDQEDNYSKNLETNKLIFVGDKVEDKYYGLESNFKINETDQTQYENVATSKFVNHLSTVNNIKNIISDVASAINKFNK